MSLLYLHLYVIEERENNSYLVVRFFWILKNANRFKIIKLTSMYPNLAYIANPSKRWIKYLREIGFKHIFDDLNFESVLDSVLSQ